jgi:F-box and leucine-rich repeat protein 2/20
MSRTGSIDNAGSLFDFDSHERFEPLSLLEDPARRPGTPPLFTRSRTSRAVFHLDDMSPPEGMSGPSAAQLKGKQAALSGASEPLAIPFAEGAQDEPDIFSLSFASAEFSSPSSRYDPLPSLEFQTSQLAIHNGIEETIEREALNESGIEKGKAREQPPTLPPLSFSPGQFSYSSTEWSSEAGPSSYSSGYSSIGDREPSPGSPSPMDRASDSAPSTPAPSPVPVSSAALRRRTISNVSRRSLRSLSTPSLPKMKVKFTTSKGAPRTLARKLLFRKSPSASPRPPSAELHSSITENSLGSDLSDLNYIIPGNCLIPWAREAQPRSPLASPVVETNSVWGVVDSQPVPRIPRLVQPVTIRTKGRAYSSPLPLSSTVSSLPLPSAAFDYVPLAPADVFQEPPLPQLSYFDDWLPHELKVQVFASLIDLFGEEFEKRTAGGKWTANKASSSRNKWVSRDRGVRELFKLSRVRHPLRHLSSQLE